MTNRQTQLAALLCGLLALLSLGASGATRAQYAYLTRGIPAGLPEPIPHGRPQLGLNVALEQYTPAELEAHLQQIADLGVRHLKQSFYLPSDGAFDWAMSDRILAAVANHPTLELTVLLNGDPATQYAPPPPAEFAQWAGEFATRYGRQITHYIIWDEPNLTSQWGGRAVNAADYAALLTAASTAIRTADSTAVIISAPLAPTVEMGPQNMADWRYLQQLYEAGAQGAFDVVAGKPYGFDSDPSDRTVDPAVLNFSRLILLREVVEAQGDGQTAVWAGNWGWNSLPAGWAGAPSAWGQTTAENQLQFVLDGLARAQREWPWAGILFVQGWQTHAPADAPEHGFDLVANPHVGRLAEGTAEPTAALPGYYLASPTDPHQTFVGGWRFSPEFGADMSEVAEGDPPDTVTLHFWGTEVGARVRRADFRARFYATVDGQPANGLPLDNGRASLVLTTADPAEDFIRLEPIATNLEPGWHTLVVEAERGWDQWALHGFSVGYRPDARQHQWAQAGLLALAVVLGGMAFRLGRRTAWPLGRWGEWFAGVSATVQGGLVFGAAAVLSLAGWFTWGAQLGGIYRRLDDVPQLALIGLSAGLFYVTPWFWLMLLALCALLAMLYWRPSWGLVLMAFSMTFYVQPVLKPIFQYRFSPIEVFALVATAAWLARWGVGWLEGFVLTQRREGAKAQRDFVSSAPLPLRPSAPRRLKSLLRTDWAVLAFVLVATLSLLFTERLDVATNEWRRVIVEPALFYLIWRGVRPNAAETWRIVDAFVLGGLLIALIGLGQYATGTNLIEAEGGVMRLRSIYGSPNNVALFLGRVWPLLAAVFLLGDGSRRRWWYGAAAVPVGLAILLSFSKGALLLGVPGSTLLVVGVWQWRRGGRIWPWVVGGLAAVAAVFLIALQIPALASRLDPRGMTGIFRLHLWQASLNMVREHPWLGVGLDNFLYAYRGRYILSAAWQEPNLNHPHNILLDFATRLGLVGLVSGGWLVGSAVWGLGQKVARGGAVLAVGLLGGLVHMLLHGLVDHSFFLVDLAFAFYLAAAFGAWKTAD